MNLKKPLRRLLMALGLLAVLLIVTAAVIALSGVSIRLDFLRPAIEKGAAQALGRPVTIEGSIELTPGLRPVVSVSRYEEKYKKELKKGPTLHDCRRAVVKNMRKSGSSRQKSMVLSGHLTEETFERYNIIDEPDIEATVKKLDEYHEKEFAKITKANADKQ
jgi:hypothetical protein